MGHEPTARRTSRVLRGRARLGGGSPGGGRPFFAAGVALYAGEGAKRDGAVADLDYPAAVAAWSSVTGVPESQFTKPYRAVADPTRRARRHEYGCLTVRYSCSSTHRRVMAAVDLLLSCPPADPA